ncbi:MAG: hypothetical protein FWE35_26980, partial [Streptosporangiales bacterium]|nr:hypothetical protein [Streptosporangiales bacterium]
PDENDQTGKGCRCTRCRAAASSEWRHRSRMKAYGRWKPLVDADPARIRIRALNEYGAGCARIAQAAGVAPETVVNILSGRNGRPPARRIREKTEAKILSVMPSLDLLGATIPVDATGTRRRIQALVRRGWSLSKISQRLRTDRANMKRLLTAGKVRAETARKVRDLYNEIWDEPPPEDGHRDQIAASRARNRAEAEGWPPPAAWDDDRIDDPAAEPADGWRRRPRNRLKGAELAAEARELARLDVTGREAEMRLRTGRKATQDAMRAWPGTSGSGTATEAVPA